MHRSYEPKIMGSSPILLTNYNSQKIHIFYERVAEKVAHWSHEPNIVSSSLILLFLFISLIIIILDKMTILYI